jgi:TolB-like protein
MKGIPMKLRAILLCLFFALMLTLPSPSVTQTRNQSTPARDPARVYKVAILPFMIYSQENLDYLREGIYNILTSRITVEERIVVMERSVVERALYEVRPTRFDEAAATKIGTKIGADYIVLGSITKVGDYISLDARLISITDEKPPLSVFTQHKGIDDVMVKIGDFAQDIGYKILGRRTMGGRLGDSRRGGGMIERFDRESVDFKRSQTFDLEIKGLDIGDVDGDKKNELVFMDTYHLYIFKYDGEKLTLFQKIEAGNEHNFLTLDVCDLNRNGHAEIIVTSVVEDEPRSFILEYEEGKFRKIAEKAGWFFRVLDHPREGPLLLAQKRGSDGLPVDPIYRMVWKKKTFERGPKMNFPKETMIFGLALGNIRSKETSDLLTLNDSEWLKIVAPGGKNLWTSRTQYGGTINFYDTKKKRAEGDRLPPPFRVYIPGRIVIKDLDGDGLGEVIVNKNSVSGIRISERVRMFDRAQIQNLVWEENGLALNWKTREIDGYISDFQVKDVDNDGEPELVVSVIDLGGISTRTGTSKIYFFKLF